MGESGEDLSHSPQLGPQLCGPLQFLDLGHPRHVTEPLAAQAVAEEEESHLRDLQRPPAGGLERFQEPVQPPKHQLLPGQQDPCQPQGLVAGTQHTPCLVEENVRKSRDPACVTLLTVPEGQALRSLAGHAEERQRAACCRVCDVLC